MKNNIAAFPSKSINRSDLTKKQYAYLDKANPFLTKGRQHHFLSTLVRFANEDNCCWRSVESFANEMRVSEKSVRRSISDLESLGLIRVVRSRKTCGRSHTNKYYLNLNCKLF